VHAQLPLEHAMDVLCGALRAAALGQHRHAALQVPLQQDLRPPTQLAEVVAAPCFPPFFRRFAPPVPSTSVEGRVEHTCTPRPHPCCSPQSLQQPGQPAHPPWHSTPTWPAQRLPRC
jgi:hypothetical protein